MSTRTAESRPNLVLFIVDEFRGDALGHMGNAAVATPRLDAIVGADGVSFRNAFCQNPVCVPSRIAMMTGWYPHVRGHRTMHHMLRPDEPNLMRRLKDAGYYVWWAGKNDIFRVEDVSSNCSEQFNPPRDRSTPYAGADNWISWWPEVGPGGYYSFYAGELPRRRTSTPTVSGSEAQSSFSAIGPRTFPSVCC